MRLDHLRRMSLIACAGIAFAIAATFTSSHTSPTGVEHYSFQAYAQDVVTMMPVIHVADYQIRNAYDSGSLLEPRLRPAVLAYRGKPAQHVKIAFVAGRNGYHQLC